jgi:hypothetical protein
VEVGCLVTVLLGVGSFIVQAATEKWAARAATTTQKELDRAIAAREIERNIVAMQLDRVRLQMADYVRCVFVAQGWLHASWRFQSKLRVFNSN